MAKSLRVRTGKMIAVRDRAKGKVAMDVMDVAIAVDAVVVIVVAEIIAVVAAVTVVDVISSRVILRNMMRVSRASQKRAMMSSLVVGVVVDATVTSETETAEMVSDRMKGVSRDNLVNRVVRWRSTRRRACTSDQARSRAFLEKHLQMMSLPLQALTHRTFTA
jgi:hypothetical protein